MRFRPILMTTMAAMLGGVPMMLGTGAGSEIRQPLGYAIVGGLAVSQLLTLYTTPVVYIYLDRLQSRLFGKRKPATDGDAKPGAGRMTASPAAQCSRRSATYRRWLNAPSNSLAVNSPECPSKPMIASDGKVRHRRRSKPARQAHQASYICPAITLLPCSLAPVSAE